MHVGQKGRDGTMGHRLEQPILESSDISVSYMAQSVPLYLGLLLYQWNRRGERKLGGKTLFILFKGGAFAVVDYCCMIWRTGTMFIG